MAAGTASDWKGIVLAGGTGTRLYPITLAAGKQMLPVYDKPMIYYPVSTLMLGGIREILIISTPEDLPRFRALLGDGARLGVRFEYAAQDAPRGIPEAFLIGETFIGAAPVCLILGDNLFYGDMRFLRNVMVRRDGAAIFAYAVQDAERYGVVEFDAAGKVLSVEEKPQRPKSRYAIPGLYCCDHRAAGVARSLRPSPRGELEITHLIQQYLAWGDLRVEVLGRGLAWLDTGTPRNLLDAANFVAAIEHRQGLKIGCLEEVAYRMGFIGADRLSGLAEAFRDNEYGRYLKQVAQEAQDPTRLLRRPDRQGV